MSRLASTCCCSLSSFWLFWQGWLSEWSALPFADDWRCRGLFKLLCQFLFLMLRIINFISPCIDWSLLILAFFTYSGYPCLKHGCRSMCLFVYSLRGLKRLDSGSQDCEVRALTTEQSCQTPWTASRVIRSCSESSFQSLQLEVLSWVSLAFSVFQLSHKVVVILSKFKISFENCEKIN